MPFLLSFVLQATLFPDDAGGDDGFKNEMFKWTAAFYLPCKSRVNQRKFQIVDPPSPIRNNDSGRKREREEKATRMQANRKIKMGFLTR